MRLQKLEYPFLFLLLSLLASPSEAAFGDKARPYWIAHGSLMFLAWAVVFPVGALLALYRKHVGTNGRLFRCFPHFYLPHLYFQMLGLVMNIVAVGLAWRGSVLEYDTGNPFDSVLWDFETDLYPWNRHVKWGVTVVFLLFLQCILGYTHHIIKHRHEDRVNKGLEPAGSWKRWVVPSWAHVIIGPLLICVAYLTIIQGFQIFTVVYFKTDSPPNGALRFGFAMVGISMIGFVLLYAYGRKMVASEDKKSEPSDKDEKDQASDEKEEVDLDA